MKKISLLFVLCIVGLLVVVESSWAGNEINPVTLSNIDSVAATPVSPSFTIAKLEPVVIDAAGQMQDSMDFSTNQDVQKQQNVTGAASEKEDNNEAGVALLAVVLILFIYGSFIAERNEGRRSYINAYPLPEKVLQNFCRQYPLLDAEDVQLVFGALKVYFCCCAPSPTKRLAMPSRLVNDLWRAFSLQANDYDAFCQQAFRYKLPYRHIEMPSSKDCDWLVIWQYACSRENQDSFSLKRLPLIFAIDSYFNIEGGLHYELTACAKKWGIDPANCG